MDPVDLLDELLSTLAALPADLPPDLIQVSLELSGRHGCLSCRFREGAKAEQCDCQPRHEREGVGALGTSPIWMAMTLVVRATGARREGLVFVAVGADPDEDGVTAGPRPIVNVANSRGFYCEVQEHYPEGFLRSVLVAAIYREAIDCGCSTIIDHGGCRYSRSDTGEALTDCNVDVICGLC